MPPASDPTAARPPSAIYTDTVTLKNGGNFTDTVTLAATSSRGWSARALPASAMLGPGATAAISVELTIPPGVAPNIGNTTTITASSSLPNVPPATAQITSTVAAAPGVSLLPPQIEQAIAAGKPITLSFTLQNTGNISQSYTLTTTGVPQG